MPGKSCALLVPKRSPTTGNVPCIDAGCALKPVAGAAGKGVCVPHGYQAGSLSSKLTQQFQACQSSVSSDLI